jgi:hypothetical protein
LAFSLVSLGFTRDKLFLWASKEMNSEAFSYAKNTVLKFLRQDGIGRMDRNEYNKTCTKIENTNLKASGRMLSFEFTDNLKVI